MLFAVVPCSLLVVGCLTFVVVGCRCLLCIVVCCFLLCVSYLLLFVYCLLFVVVCYGCERLMIGVVCLVFFVFVCC